MDKPACRLCGAKHYASEPHAFGGVKLTEPRKPNVSVASKPNAVQCERCAVLEREVAELRGKLESRRVYQREYMRKRRSNAD